MTEHTKKNFYKVRLWSSSNKVITCWKIPGPFHIIKSTWNSLNRCGQCHHNRLKHRSINGIRHKNMLIVHTSFFCAMVVFILIFWLIRYLVFELTILWRVVSFCCSIYSDDRSKRQLKVGGQLDGNGAEQMRSIPQEKIIISVAVLQLQCGVIVDEVNFEVITYDLQTQIEGSDAFSYPISTITWVDARYDTVTATAISRAHLARSLIVWTDRLLVSNPPLHTWIYSGGHMGKFARVTYMQYICNICHFRYIFIAFLHVWPFWIRL